MHTARWQLLQASNNCIVHMELEKRAHADGCGDRHTVNCAASWPWQRVLKQPCTLYKRGSSSVRRAVTDAR